MKKISSIGYSLLATVIYALALIILVGALSYVAITIWSDVIEIWGAL